jgi:hypothetical protein
VEQRQSRGTRRYDGASAVVWLIGISQGIVPLVAHGVFGRDDRIALPLRLAAPWWWITCLAVVALAVAALLGIDAAKERAAPGPPVVDQAEEPETAESSDPAAGYDALSGLVLLVGVYNGLAPFVSRLIFDGHLFLAFPLRLPSPWWWLVSLAVLALTALLLVRIDKAKERSASREER